MRISDWSSDVCSSDLRSSHGGARLTIRYYATDRLAVDRVDDFDGDDVRLLAEHMKEAVRLDTRPTTLSHMRADPVKRSEEHTSELQSPMSISYAVLRLKQKTNSTHNILYIKYNYTK